MLILDTAIQGTTNNPFNIITQSNIVDGSLLGIVLRVMLAASIIAAILALFKLAKVYYDDEMEAITNPDVASEQKYKEMGRIFMIAVLIVGYLIWITPLVATIKVINGITAQDSQVTLESMRSAALLTSTDHIRNTKASSITYVLKNPDKFPMGYRVMAQREREDAETWKQSMSQSLLSEENVAVDNTSVEDQIKKYVQAKDNNSTPETSNPWGSGNLARRIVDGIGDLFGNITAYLLGGITNMLTYIIRPFILIVVTFIWKLLIIIGPLALASSIYWKEAAEHWFKMFINVGFTFTTINIIDHLNLGFIKIFTTWNSVYNTDVNIVFGFFILGAYMSVFKITSWWIGKADGGRLAGKTAAAGALTVTAATKLASGAMSGSKIFGSSGSLQKIAQTLAGSAASGRKRMTDE